VIQALRLSADHALVADDRGAVTLFARSTGTRTQRIAHNVALTDALAVMDGLLVVADREGRIAAYRIAP
jgi:hypothetical protein